jgi:branched-chain amino acid aminotransferase
MNLKIYIDGNFYDQSEAKISVFDHGLLYGDGVFEGIRFYNDRVFRLEEHIDRLWDSAKAIAMELPLSKRFVRTIFITVISGWSPLAVSDRSD